MIRDFALCVQFYHATSAVIARVGASNLANRKFLSITPRGAGIYLGGPGVNIATGTPLFLNQTVSIDVSDNVNVYLIGTLGSVDVRIIEGA